MMIMHMVMILVLMIIITMRPYEESRKTLAAPQPKSAQGGLFRGASRRGRRATAVSHADLREDPHGPIYIYIYIYIYICTYMCIMTYLFNYLFIT